MTEVIIVPLAKYQNTIFGKLTLTSPHPHSVGVGSNKKKNMKYLSLFSGIGGFEIGIQKAYENLDNWGNTSTSELAIHRDKSLPNNSNGNGRRTNPTCIGYSEIDKYAIQIYQKHFNHKNYGDTTKIIASELPDFDLLVGGFPCQAFSIAGKRGGFDDTRGTLFFDIARILKEKRPRNFVLENVKGLLSHDSGRTFKTIITTLAELGYCVEWQVLNAKNFGVPQNRERVFIVGHLGGIPERKVFPIGESNGKSKEISQLNNPRHSNDRVYDPKGISPTLNTAQGGNRQPNIITSTITTENAHGFRKNVTANQVYDISVLTGKIRRLTPLECERLMGYPDGWTEGVSDTQRYKTLGNGIVSNVVAEVIKRLTPTQSE